ncbi:MAG: DNA methyltransferase [Candidatus Thermoplasmatota archaeon]|nr:DNA methyltransferase [Candidatus Thermoplasmatota archaeon]
MKGFIHLSGEHTELARAELEGALRSLGSELVPVHVSEQVSTLGGQVPEGLAGRMGLCHFTGILDDTVEPSRESILDSVRKELEMLDRSSTISLKVKVSKKTTGISSAEIFNDVVSLLSSNGFKVNYRDPRQWLFIITLKESYIGRIIEWSDRKAHRSRRGSRLPFNRPIVMHPKLARAMVNISALPEGSTVLDPFLGPGGLAMEASALGHRVIGVERDPEIYHGSKVNIHHMDIADRIEVHNGDSRRIMEYPWGARIKKVDGIITDPPFGRSAATMGEEPGKLLREVLGNVSDLLPVGAPLVLDSASQDIIDSIEGFRRVKIIPVRVHKSMTRHVALLLKE